MSNKHTTISGILGRRRVIPRWKSAQSSISANEQRALKLPPSRRLQNWENWRTRLTSKHNQYPEDPAVFSEYKELSFLIDNQKIETRLPFEIGEISSAKVSDPEAGEEDQNSVGVEYFAAKAIIGREKLAIRNIKNGLASDPNRPLQWAELGRLYLSLGLDEKSEKAMLCAMQLAPSNRYLTRSAARLYVHVDKLDNALNALRSNSRFSKDPWLLAADIAISTISDKTSKFYRLAQTLIESNKFHDADLSELRSALATVEAVNGKHKRARKLFEDSLLSPTENSIAQAQWANEENMLRQFSQEHLSFEGAFEARARQARSEERWDDVLSAAEAWLDEEAYSSHPAAIGSYPCFTPQQIARSVAMATRGIYSSPSNILLRNNRAVSYIYSGNYPSAVNDLLTAMSVSDAKASFHLLATTGLLLYRVGDVKGSQLCYAEAVDRFISKKDLASAVLALLYFIKEQFCAANENSKVELDKVRTIAKRLDLSKQPEISSMFKHIESLGAPSYILPSNLNAEPGSRDLALLKDRVGKLFNVDLNAGIELEKFWQNVQNSEI